MKKIIIIGAGILGASTAYRLSKQGAQVIVIDREEPGGATAAAAGIICPWLSQRRNQVWYQLAKAGASYYPRLIKELEEDGEVHTGYEQVGALCIHQDRRKLEAMQQRALSRREDAPEIGEVKLLNEEETKAYYPPISDDYASLYVSGAARVDGGALRDAMLRAAQTRGAQFIQGNAKLLQHKQKVVAVEVAGQQLYADEIIVCTGAWAKELLHPIGIMLDVRYQKAQIMHLQTMDEHSGKWPVIISPSSHYLLSFADQRVVLGATHENVNDGYDCSATAGGMYEVLDKGLHVASGLAACSLKEIRVGFRPFTPGFLPVFGRVAGWEGIIVANGLGSSGLTVGPFLGDQLARLSLEKKLDIKLEDYALEQAMLKEEH